MLYEKYRTWRTCSLKEENGVLVAADRAQEWLLPIWWEKYTLHNTAPVTFVDFGLSVDKKQWCQERGEYVPLFVADIFVKNREEVAHSLVAKWETRCGDLFWNYRSAWFKKPLACLQSPYRKTIWLDLDCLVAGSINPLFNLTPLSLALDRGANAPHYPIYNSGVIVFERNLPLIQKWADFSFEKNEEFFGDQDLLSHLIFQSGYPICKMPLIYNWPVALGEDPTVVVYHWIGPLGKEILKRSYLNNTRQIDLFPS